LCGHDGVGFARLLAITEPYFDVWQRRVQCRSFRLLGERLGDMRLGLRLRLKRHLLHDHRGPPAGAGQGSKPAGIACQQAGISTLQALGLLSAVAKDGIEVEGVGVLDFKTVLELHRTMPELFRTGGVSVVVNGVAVPATWCD
jgi:hypothetical protein